VELLRGCRSDGRHFITLLAAQGVRSASAVPELAKMAKDADYAQRRKALLALGRIGKVVPEDTLPEVVAAVSDAQNHRDGKTRWQAFLAMMQIDPVAARAKLPASLHPAVNELSGRVTDLRGVSNWTRCLWHDSIAVLVPSINLTSAPDDAGVYRTPIDWDIFFENDRLDHMVTALTRAGSFGPDAVPFLVDVWQGTDRSEIAGLLTKIGPGGLPYLARDLEDHAAKEMQLKILGVIQTFGPKAKSAIPSLVKAVAGPNEEVCEKAGETLGKLGPDAKDAVPGLRKYLKSKNNDTRRHAADALGLLGAEAKPAIPDLIELFPNDNQQLRVVAIRAVSRIGREAVQPLTEALKSPREPVRLGAVQALTRLKEVAQPALPALHELAQNDPSNEVRAEAAELVKTLQP
jgi:HEAT repeat protein